MKKILSAFVIGTFLFIASVSIVSAQGQDPATLILPCPAHDSAPQAAKNNAKVGGYENALCIETPRVCV